MKEKESKCVEKPLLNYLKNGIIKTVEAPLYGQVTFTLKEGKVVLIEKKETIKI